MNDTHAITTQEREPLSTEIAFKHRSCIPTQWQKKLTKCQKWALVEVSGPALILRKYRGEESEDFLL